MKTLFTLFISTFLSFNYLFATVYTTTSDGNINGSIWSPSTPSSPLAAGDEMIINHDVILNADFTVHGKITINSGASLIGSNKKLKIGSGSTTGEFINSGNLVCKDLDIKGDDSVANATAPSAINNGTITANKLHVGDNSAAGILTNTDGASILVNGELHIDNILTNAGTISVGGKIKNHGGILQGGGTITSCQIEFDENNSRQGQLLSQNICCDFSTLSEPSYKRKSGSTYASLELFVGAEGTSGTHHFIDDVDYFSCNKNALGQLPVELIDFRAEEDRNHEVLLSWITESEINNKHFEVERSSDGRNFDAIGLVLGNGNSSNVQQYSFLDSKPVPMAYYRLKQVDFNGDFEFSNVIILEMENFDVSKLEAFPTIAEHEITLRFTTFNTKKSILRIINTRGNIMHEEEVYSSNQLEYRTIDLSRYQLGIYNISLSNGHDFITKPFVVTKTY